MAGLGRRSHYRKHLTDSVLYDLPEPSQNERIAKVTGTRGSNQFELVVDPGTGTCTGNSGSGSGSGSTLTPQLAILPTKFRKLVWLKRNDYVICAVAGGDENGNGNGNDNDSKNGHRKREENGSGSGNGNGNKNDDGGIRYMIEHILYKDQIKHLKDQNLWPTHDFFNDSSEADNAKDTDGIENDCNQEENGRNSNGVVKGDGDGVHDSDEDEDGHGEDDGIVYTNVDDAYFCNMNRIAKLKVDDSSDEDSDSD